MTTLPSTRADALQQSHAAAQPQHDGFDLDDVARVDGPAVADALDAREEDQALAVLGLRENQDRADLRDRLGQNRRRQHGRAVRRARGSAR